MKPRAATPAPPPYLAPYLQAVARHGAGFRSLLWANPGTQHARFDAICRLCDLNNRTVLDVGCGRADLLDFLLDRNIRPAHYYGLEAVDALAAAARAKPHPACTIIQGDFIRQPQRLFVGADVVLFSGSLNTLSRPEFEQILPRAFAAAGQTLVFNFLASSSLAGRSYLTWYPRQQVLTMLSPLTDHVRYLEDYLPGDCTVAADKGD